MKLNFTKFTIALIVIAGLSCAKKKDDEATDSYDASSAVIESGVSAISGVADDVAGSAFAQNYSEKSSSPFFDLLIAKAQAASCLRPVAAACVSGLRSINYSGCDLPSGVRTFSGTASLTYSNVSCTLSSVNDYVTRAYQIDIAGPAGGVVTTSSAVKQDYTGLSYGGGGRLTVRAGYYDLEILGKHKSFVRNGRTLYDVSLRTTTPLQTTSIVRSGRQVTSGQLEVNHNLAKFTTRLSFSNLQWGTCCHPTSGSIGFTHTGSKQGSGTVTFTGCGTAQLTEDGQTRNFEMSYCE